MNRLKILPYKMNSMSSKAISKYFNVKRVYPNRNYRPSNGDIVLNWGYGGIAPVLEAYDVEYYHKNFIILNKPMAVDRASDKVATLRLLKQNNVSHVEFFLTTDDAVKSCEEGNTIYCRTLTRGREGKGIVLATKPEEVVPARLYTKYFENDHEYRIHVFNGEVIDEVEKRIMSPERMVEKHIHRDESSDYIRNMKKGWSFCRLGLDIKDHVRKTAIDATKALGLDFAAVDIAYNSKTNECKVLELNTAPGQKVGTTTHLRYVKAISKYLGVPFSVEEYNNRYNCNAENYLR